MEEKNNSITDFIGNTPIIKINKLFKIFKSNFYCKCEFMNPTGFMEDRIAKNHLKNLTFVENNELEIYDINLAISYSLVASQSNIPLKLTTNEYVPFEKSLYLKSLGCKINAPNYKNKEHINKPNIKKESIDIHYSYNDNKYRLRDVAIEINENFPGKIDYIFINGNLSGAIAGIGSLMKILKPGIKVIGVKYFLNEIPCVLDRGVADEWINISNIEVNNMLKTVIKKEGLLVGNISAMTLVGAYKYFEELEKNNNKIYTSMIILPDSLNYSMGSLIS